MRSTHFIRTAAIAGIFLTLQFFSIAQNRREMPPSSPASAPVAPGTGAPSMPPMGAPKTGPKPSKEVITGKAKSSKGLFTVHKVDDKFYFELNESLFGREIMAITRFSKVAGGGGVYGG